MTDLDLQLFLLQSTITYTKNSHSGISIINLIMVLICLFFKWIVCQTHQIKHGLDDLAMVSEFIIGAPNITLPSRHSYKNARWDLLNLEVKNQLCRIEKIDSITNLERYIKKLINIVLKDIEKLVPLAKLSGYNKRW